jgi:hypothetical protein
MSRATIAFVLGVMALAGCAAHPEPAAKAPEKPPTPVAPKTPEPSPELGMKLYPGMKLVADSLVTTSTPLGESANANYTTPDPVDKVVAFYQKELGAEAKVEKSNENGTDQAVVTLSLGDTVQSATVSRNKGEDVTTVSLTKNSRTPAKG